MSNRSRDSNSPRGILSLAAARTCAIDRHRYNVRSDRGDGGRYVIPQALCKEEAEERKHDDEFSALMVINFSAVAPVTGNFAGISSLL